MSMSARCMELIIMTGAAWRDGTRLIVRSRVVDDAFSRPPGAYRTHAATTPRHAPAYRTDSLVGYVRQN